MAKHEDGDYHVDRISIVDDQIRALVDRALVAGRRQGLFAALKTILQRLKTSPLTWGDPERRTRKKGGTVFHAICDPLLVHYVAYEVERVVFILGIRGLPESELQEP